MTIDTFKRRSNFFDNNKITAFNLDLQFNNIVSYINNDVIAYINKIITDRYQGTDNPLLRNSFLINTGDGTLKWDFIKDESFQYYGISLSKLEKGIENSILAVDANNNYIQVPANENNIDNVLISKKDNLPIWKKLEDNNFEDKSITGDNIKLRSITRENMDQNTFNILDNSIENIKFTEGCVTNDNLIDAERNNDDLPFPLEEFVLTEDRLTPEVQDVFYNMITSNMMKDSYINNYFDIIFGGNKTYLLNIGEYFRIIDLNVIYPINKFKIYNNIKDYIENYSIDNLQLKSIDGCRLIYFNTNSNDYNPSYNSLILDGSILPEHLDPALRTSLDL